MVLSDGTLYALGERLLEPYDRDKVQPSSIDLRLGQSFRVFHSHKHQAVYLTGRGIPEDLTDEVMLEDGQHFTVHPGEFVLGSTLEQITVPNDLVARIEGKSSVGRVGLIVHATAGFIDPGFSGNLTLEMTNLLRVPIVLKPGIDICQVSFMQLDKPALVPYAGRYQHDEGAVASRYGNR